LSHIAPPAGGATIRGQRVSPRERHASPGRLLSRLIPHPGSSQPTGRQCVEIDRAEWSGKRPREGDDEDRVLAEAVTLKRARLTGGSVVRERR